MVILGAEEHVKVARPIHHRVLTIVGIIGLVAIATGAWAIYMGTRGNTTIGILGMHITTTSIGVAVIGTGIISTLVVLRSLLKNIERLAAIRPDRRNR